MKFKDWNNQEFNLPKDRQAKWRPSAYALIIENKKILLINSSIQKKWDIPGGAIELDETIEQGLIREIHEETGQQAKVDLSKIFYFSDNFFYVESIDAYFRALPMVFTGSIKNYDPKIKPPHYESLEAKWFDLDKLPDKLSDIAKKSIANYQKTVRK